MKLIERLTSVWKNNSVEEMINWIKKEDFEKHWDEWRFKVTKIKLVIWYDSDNWEYVAKLFDEWENWKFINLTNHENKTKFRSLVSKMINAEDSLKNLDRTFDLDEDSKFDNMSDSEMDEYLKWNYDNSSLIETKIQTLEREIMSIYMNLVTDVITWNDDWFISTTKWLTPSNYWEFLKKLKLESRFIKDLRIDSKEPIWGNTHFWHEICYNYRKWEYFQEENKYLIYFWVSLKSWGSQSYKEEVIELSLKNSI